MSSKEQALAAKVADLRAQVAALEAERDALTAGIEAHRAGLSALAATIERACEEAEMEPTDRFARECAEVDEWLANDRARREAAEAAAEAVTP